MEAITRNIIPVITELVKALVNGRRLVLKEKNPPVVWADKAQGDGGVDVTGAPKSTSVEGADFGQLSGLPVKFWPYGQI